MTETKKYEYKGNIYWVTIDDAINTASKQTGLVAYVSDYEPTAFQWGMLVRDNEHRIMLFGDKLAALTNANAIKQSEIDSRPH